MQALFARSQYSQAMGFRLAEARDGRARVECVVSEGHLNTQGLCHGGVISGLMDMAVGVAAKSMLDDPQRPVATVSLTVNYQRPGELDRTLTAEATIQSGRRILSAAVAVRDDRGESVAVGVATLKVGRSRRIADDPPPDDVP
jgi:acyl-CoA thioesterase